MTSSTSIGSLKLQSQIKINLIQLQKRVSKNKYAGK